MGIFDYYQNVTINRYRRKTTLSEEFGKICFDMIKLQIVTKKKINYNCRHDVFTAYLKRCGPFVRLLGS